MRWAYAVFALRQEHVDVVVQDRSLAVGAATMALAMGGDWGPLTTWAKGIRVGRDASGS